MTQTVPVRPVPLANLALCLAALTGPLAGTSLGDEKPVTAADLFPLKKGAKWEIAAASNPDVTEQVLEVMGTKVVDQDVCYEVANTAEKKSFATSRWYYSVTKDGIYLRATGNGSPKLYGRKAWCVLKNRSAEVQKWTIREGGDEGSGYKYKLKFEIPAGSPYDEVYKSTVFEVKCAQYNEMIEYGGQKVEATIVVQVETNVGYNLLYKKDNALTDTKFFSQPHENSVTTTTHYVRGKGVVREQQHVSNNATGRRVEPERAYDRVTRKVSGVGSVSVGDVVINKNDVESDTPVAVDRYRLEPGDEAEFKFSRTITREIEFTVKDTKGREGGGSVGLDFGYIKGELSGKIRAAVETSVGEKLKDEETRERKIVVRNTTKNVRKGEIVWVDIYKTGKVEISQDGEKYEVQFRFPFGTRLESRNKE